MYIIVRSICFPITGAFVIELFKRTYIYATITTGYCELI